MVPDQAPASEGSVDRGDCRRSVFADGAFGGGGLEPCFGLVPVPEGAAGVVSGG